MVAKSVPRVVMVTGASTFVGGYLAARLAQNPQIERVIAVDAVPPSKDLLRRMEPAQFFRVEYRSHTFTKLIDEHGVDTVVHAATSIADHRSADSQSKEALVFGSMRVFGACNNAPSVRRVVMRSSTSVYGADSRDPGMLTEDQVARTSIAGHARDLLDAEAYARSLARRRPDVDLSIIRLAPLVGPNIDAPMTKLLSGAIVPTIMGRDARLQLLHHDDAIAALQRAVFADVAGIFNVAGSGVVSFRQAVRLLGRIEVPVIAPAWGWTYSAVRGVRKAASPHTAYLTYGAGIDTTRMRTVLGFEPSYSTRGAIEDLARGQRLERVISRRFLRTVEGGVSGFARKLAGVS